MHRLVPGHRVEAFSVLAWRGVACVAEHRGKQLAPCYKSGCAGAITGSRCRRRLADMIKEFASE